MLSGGATTAPDADANVVAGTGDDIIAVQAGRCISRAAFARDAAALAAILPAHRHVLNLCTDRYRFMVGLVAALRRGQISLLAPSDAPGVIEALAADYPDVYALTDGAALPVPTLRYPDRLLHAAGAPAPLLVPATQPALILFTSGSTGRPKPVPKTWGALVRSVAAAGRRLGLSGLRGATLVGTVPHQHSYGLESLILLALRHGVRLAAGWPLYPGDIRAALDRAPRPRILVTSPVHIRALLAEPDDLPPVDLILCATAPLPPALAVAAEARFGAPLIEIYGCTEAGQVATRRSAGEAQWTSLEGVNLSQDEHGCWASGPAVEGRALLQDVIERTGPTTFMLGDRAADMVNIAGKRTSLAYLNHQLLDIAGVQDGAFLKPDDDGAGVARLTALAVAPGLTAEAIFGALRSRIDAAFLPRPLLLVDRLPRNALGKLPRAALLRLAGRDQGA